MIPESIAEKLDKTFQKAGIVFNHERDNGSVFKTQISATPSISFEHDLNGGNSDRPLVIGGYEFFSSQDYLRKGGFALSGSINGSAILIWANERSIEFQLNASELKAIEDTELRISSVIQKSCSKNFIGNDFYIDLCSTDALTKKKLSNSSAQDWQLTLSRLFGASLGLSTALNSERKDKSKSKKISLGVEHSRSNVNTAAILSFGFDVSGEEAALTRRIDLGVSRPLRNLVLGTFVNFGRYEKGSIFGQPYDYERSEIGIDLVSDLGLVKLGYVNQKGSMSFHDNEYPRLSWSYAF